MSLFTDLQKTSEEQKAQLEKPQHSTQDVTWQRDIPREKPRKDSRKKQRSHPRDIPGKLTRETLSRDQIQYFNFVIRDELKSKAKVQAEVPVEWTEELDDLCHRLGVKKLELYRYIIGVFLGKTQRMQNGQR